MSIHRQHAVDLLIERANDQRLGLKAQIGAIKGLGEAGGEDATSALLALARKADGVGTEAETAIYEALGRACRLEIVRG